MRLIWYHITLIIVVLMGQQLSDCLTLKDFGDSLWPSDQRDGTDSLNDQEIVPVSDIRPTERRIWIITTAALPWMTGTSINPLLRAAHLAKGRPAGKVTLMVPWLDEEQQEIAQFKKIYNDPEDQKAMMYEWLKDADLQCVVDKLDIRFYTGRYHDEYHSIFPMGDIAELIPDNEADVCILEEPEHLNWYRAPFTTKPWTEKFHHVVGIIHTNYLAYTRTYQGGYIKEPLLYYVNQGMCRAYTHKIIKLSNALQEFAPEKEITCNVHGVRELYLNEGDLSVSRGFSKGVYFVGKLAWPKGLDSLLDFMLMIKKRTGRCFHVDIFGSGPHEDDIAARAVQYQLPTTFHGAKDHSILTDYKVFVNPSKSEVLCTTVIEALAMGKWVIVPRHPSNEFFYKFDNCLTYETAEEFAANVFWSLNTDPKPLTAELRYELTWEAATERLIQSSKLTKQMQKNTKQVADKFALWLHDMVSSGAAGDSLRSLAGGKAAAGQMEFIKKYGTSSPRSANDLTALAVNIEAQEYDSSGLMSPRNLFIEGTPSVVDSVLDDD
jgi:digalactosyldiacylglycerol synthase